MITEGQLKYYKAGLASVLMGFLVLMLGSMDSFPTSLQATYPTELYWYIAFAILGSGLVLIGVAVVIVGSLRQHEVSHDQAHHDGGGEGQQRAQ